MPISLRAESIRKQFPTRGDPLVVLRDVSLTLDAGESAVITGPSGSGKSTLLNILGTLEPPTAGRVAIEERNPFELGDRELAEFRNQTIGFVFQDHHLLPQCNVLENVLLPSLASRKGGDATKRARGLLARVGLSDRLDHRPAELSGGERQRVAIARALVNHPALILADEPTGNLDRSTGEAVGSLLCDIQKDEGVTLVVVTHSRHLADRFAREFNLVDGVLAAADGE